LGLDRIIIERIMRKSIGDNMIPNGWSFEKGLELIRKSGFDGVELWLGESERCGAGGFQRFEFARLGRKCVGA
jgi:hypothetical protein